MFGIDLGITVSSVTCMTERNEVIDYTILFGNTKLKNDWKRVNQMADAILNSIHDTCKSKPDRMVIDQYVSIEEPVLIAPQYNPTARARSFFQLSCLYALVRYKLTARKFTIYSINPLSAKSTARALGFKGEHIPEKLGNRGRLNKRGMIEAYLRLTGKLPDYHTIAGRETLADSFFIGRAGLDRRKVGLK